MSNIDADIDKMMKDHAVITGVGLVRANFDSRNEEKAKEYLNSLLKAVYIKGKIDYFDKNLVNKGRG